MTTTRNLDVGAWRRWFGIFAVVGVLLGCPSSGTQKPDKRDYDDIPTGATDAQIDVRAIKIVRQAQAAMLRGDAPAAIELFKQALSLYEKTGDFAAQGAIYNDIALMVNGAGQGERALELLEKARALGEKGDEPVVPIEAIYNTGVVLRDLGRDDEAITQYSKALEEARTARADEMIGFSLNGRANLHRRNDRIVEATKDYRGALAVWGKLGRNDLAAVENMNLGYCLVLTGDGEKAAAAFQDAIDAFGDTESPDRDILVPHLQEMIRLVKRDAAEARIKVEEVLGKR